MSHKSPYKQTTRQKNIISTLEKLSVKSQDEMKKRKEPSTKEMFSLSSSSNNFSKSKKKRRKTYDCTKKRKSKFNISNHLRSSKIVLEQINEDSSSLSQAFTAKKMKNSDFLSNLSYPDGTFSIANGASLDPSFKSHKSLGRSIRSRFFMKYQNSKFSKKNEKEKIYVAKELCSKEEKIKENFVEERIHKYRFGGSRGLFSKSRLKDVEEDSFRSEYSG